MEIVELDDQRPVPGERLEEPARRPGDVVGRGGADAETDRLRQRERRLPAPDGVGEQLA